jgi:hypothetical protein
VTALIFTIQNSKINCWPFSIPKALTYFEDAEESEVPVSLNNQTWDSVKKANQKSVREYLS